jgi:hypothetical protein
MTRDKGIKGNKSDLIKAKYLLYLLGSSRLVSLLLVVSLECNLVLCYINRGIGHRSHRVFRVSNSLLYFLPRWCVTARWNCANEGQGHYDHSSILLSIHQCLAIYLVSSPLPVTTWYPEAQVPLLPPWVWSPVSVRGARSTTCSTPSYDILTPWKRSCNPWDAILQVWEAM